jgi:outer membrane receptor for ferrienterochelin and colicins
MIRRIFLFFLLISCFTAVGYTQVTDANIFGDVKSKGEHVPFVTVYLEGTTSGTTTDNTGHYMLVNLPVGDYTLVAQALGYKKQTRKVTLVSGKSIEVNFDLEEEVISLEDVVITGTKTFKRQTDSPVIVNVLDAKTMNLIQVNTLSEGLVFQPGLRLETDCQTCNYTQLRMNGLGGGYSQILINSRPVFSPLTGLYGLEQIPSNMIERIEVVRGGGSALYGSSAIGGTVNVITRTPDKNSYEVMLNQGLVGMAASDNQLNGNLSVLSQKRNAGVSIFAARRDRSWYDHNGDGYSELPHLKSNSFGFTSFVRPTPNQKIELSLTSVYEYRFGGEKTDGPAHESGQSEERTHNLIMGGIDYEIDFNDDNSSFIFYAAGQNNTRKHYTGIIPDDSAGIVDHFMNPPYGNTLNNTFQAGLQVNHRFTGFLGGVNIFTLGAEYLSDQVDDRIPAYQYHLDQTASGTGLFLQSDWLIIKGLTLLTGIRADKHNLLENWVFNPRVSLLYKLGKYYQFRTTLASGFRAPQAFDSDMHFSFAAGGVSRIILSSGLEAEYATTFNGSINFDKPTEKFVYGFTLEGFNTRLRNTFVLEEIGSDNFGLIYEKRNAAGSSVSGATAEIRGNYNRKAQIEAGVTFQRSRYDNPVTWSNDLEPLTTYLRTPDVYGYSTLTFTPNGRFSGSLTSVFTGPMKLLHVSGSPAGEPRDVYTDTKPFTELNIRLAYNLPSTRLDTEFEIFGGVKNVLDAYQKDFDTGKYRDSNYIYGPSAPRTFFIGLRIKSL